MNNDLWAKKENLSIKISESVWKLLRAKYKGEMNDDPWSYMGEWKSLPAMLTSDLIYEIPP